MIVLAFGSNMGDKVANLDTALAMLRLRGVQILRVSSYLRTDPWGKTDQDDFVNAVATVHFAGTPHELLDICLAIELEMGRIRLEKWGPRLIDIDLIMFHNITIHDERLILPHPYYHEREFVLSPMQELGIG